MAEKTKEVGIRLAVKDADIAKRALAQFGQEGEAALKRLEASSKPASAGMTALAGTIDQSKEKGTEFFRSLTLGVLGPVAAFLSLEGAVEGVKSALEGFSKVNDEAKAAGIDAEFFQGIAYQAQLSGIGIDQVSGALETFNKNVGQAQAGTGKMLAQLRAVDPELLAQLQTATSQEERIRLVADAIDQEADASKKASIIAATFGADMLKLGDAFDGGRVKIAAMQAQARDIGIIVPDDLISRADDLGDKFDIASKIIEVQFKAALLDLAPGLVSTANLVAALAVNVGALVDQFQAVGDRVHLAPLQNQLVMLENQIHDLNADIKSQQTSTDAMPDWSPLKGFNQSQLAGKKRYLEQLYQQAAQYQDRINQLMGSGKTPPAVDDTAIGDRAQELRDYLSGHAAQFDQSDKIDKVTAALRNQTANLTATDKELEENKALEQAGIDRSDKRAAGIIAAADAYYDQKKAIDEANQAASFFAQTAEQGIEGLIDGSKSLTDALGDVAKALEQAVLQAALLGEGPLGNIFGGAAQTPGGTGGILGSILSGLGIGKNALGGVYGSPDLASYSDQLIDTPTMFRFSKGGVPNLGQFGEAGTEGIFPIGRDSNGRLGVFGAGGGGAPKVTVNVHNNTGQPIDASNVKVSRGADGAINIDLLLSQQVKPGSATDRALRTQFGLKRQLTRR